LKGFANQQGNSIRNRGIMKPIVHPTKEAFKNLSEKSNLIPVYREILADTETPIRVFRTLGSEPYAFLLESVEGGEKWSRYSFMGMDPMLTFQS